MRVRRKPWAAGEIAQNSHMIHDPASFRGHWKDAFGNDNPIYLEIGCGKGQFLSGNSLRYPDVNFIGIERDETVIATAARRLSESQKNLRLVNANVVDLLDFFTPGEIDRLYINFCDPWPRKKWAKRRLSHRLFLGKYAELLGEHGEIFFKTDNRLLFEFSLNEFCATDWRLSKITLDLHHSEWAEDNITTEYEEKFSSMGMPIYRLEARYEPRNQEK